MSTNKRTKTDEPVDIPVSDVAEVWAMKKTKETDHDHLVCIEIFTETEEDNEARDKEDPDGLRSRRQSVQVFSRMKDAEIIQLQMMIGQRLQRNRMEIDIKPAHMRVPFRKYIDDSVGKFRFVYQKNHPVNRERYATQNQYLKENYDHEMAEIQSIRAELDVREQALVKEIVPESPNITKKWETYRLGYSEPKQDKR